MYTGVTHLSIGMCTRTFVTYQCYVIKVKYYFYSSSDVKHLSYHSQIADEQ